MLISRIKLWIWHKTKGLLFGKWYFNQWWKAFSFFCMNRKEENPDGHVIFKGTKIPYKDKLV